MSQSVSEIKDYLSQAHILAANKNDRIKLLNRFLKIEASQIPIPGFIVHFDFYKSEKYFKNHYSFINRKIFPFIEKLAQAYGFRWKGSYTGDGAFFCLANKLDPKLQLVKDKALAIACLFAVDINSIFSNLSYDQISFNHQLELDPSLLKNLKQISQENDAFYFRLRTGISYGSVSLTNRLAGLYPVNENLSQPMLEAARVSNYGWGVYLAKNRELINDLSSKALTPKPVLNILDQNQNLCLVKIDKLKSKRAEYSAYRVFRTKQLSSQLIKSLNFNIKQIEKWSEHNHFEGNYSSLNFNNDNAEFYLQSFIQQSETWQIQLQLLKVCQNQPDPKKRQLLMVKEVKKLTQQVVTNLIKQNISSGYLYISPHNVAKDINNLSSLNLKNIKLVNLDQINLLPSNFIPLNMETYLSSIKQILQEENLNLELIVALRKNEIESWYLQHPENKSTDNFISQLKQFKKKT